MNEERWMTCPECEQTVKINFRPGVGYCPGCESEVFLPPWSDTHKGKSRVPDLQEKLKKMYAKKSNVSQVEMEDVLEWIWVLSSPDNHGNYHAFDKESVRDIHEAISEIFGLEDGL